MRPFFFIGLGLLVLSAVAWAIRPAGGDGRTPLVWVSDDAPTRRLTIELFEKLHPEIDLRLDPDNTGMEKIIVQSLGGVGPDVFDCRSPNQLAAFVQSGIAGDITDDLKAAGIDLATESWPLVQKHFTLDGRVYGVPANAGVDALWFNKDIFEREGIPFPHELKDWPAVVALAERLTVRDAAGRVTRFGLSFDDAEWLLLLHNFGGNVFSADGTRCVLDSPQAIAAVQFIQDLIFKYKVTASPGEQDAAAQEGGWGNYSMRALVGGHAAMSFGGRWWLLTLRKDPALRLGVAVLPIMPGGFMMGGGKGTLLNAKSPHRKAAMEFLKFMAGPEYNRLLNREADAMGGIIRYATDDNLNNPQYPAEDFHATFRQVMNGATAEERSPFVDAAEADRIINKQLDLVRRNAKTAADGMKTAATQVNDEIAKSLRQNPALAARFDSLTRRGDVSRTSNAPTSGGAK